jgi:hypothetical protein
MPNLIAFQIVGNYSAFAEEAVDTFAVSDWGVARISVFRNVALITILRQFTCNRLRPLDSAIGSIDANKVSLERFKTTAVRLGHTVSRITGYEDLIS